MGGFLLEFGRVSHSPGGVLGQSCRVPNPRKESTQSSQSSGRIWGRKPGFGGVFRASPGPSPSPPTAAPPRYDYKIAREYNWNVKNKASKGYEENYFFIFREGDGVYYNELETRWGWGHWELPQVAVGGAERFFQSVLGALVGCSEGS